MRKFRQVPQLRFVTAGLSRMSRDDRDDRRHVTWPEAPEMKVGNPIAIGFQDGAYVGAADQEGPATGTAGKDVIAHFATHCAMAGELKGSSEPRLILTPPAIASEEDDGYLSTSEIAALKLHADLGDPLRLQHCRQQRRNGASPLGPGPAPSSMRRLAPCWSLLGRSTQRHH
jgi:hypothetical protein